MPLILAIEPDRRQAAQLRSIVKSRLDAELVLADSADHALAAMGHRVPDLILTAALLPPKDEAALDARLRALDGAAAHVQTLTIPVLAAPQSAKRGGMLSALRRRSRKAAPDGCDPAVFADQCAEYLERARTERAAIGEQGLRVRVVPSPADVPPSEAEVVTRTVEHEEVTPLAWQELELTSPPEMARPVSALTAEIAERTIPVGLEVPISVEIDVPVTVSVEVAAQGILAELAQDAPLGVPRPGWMQQAPEPVPVEAPEPVGVPAPEPATMAGAKRDVPLRLGLTRVWPEMMSLSTGSEPPASEADANTVDILPGAPLPEVEPVFLESETRQGLDSQAPDDAETYEINVDELFKDLDPVLTVQPSKSAPVSESLAPSEVPETIAAAPSVDASEPEETGAQPPDDAFVVEFEPAGDTPLSAAGIEIDPALWTPSRLGVSQLWPPIEGGLATERPVAFVDVTPTRPVEEAPAPAMSFSVPVSRQPADPEPPVRPAWLDVVESLRRDVERLQAERAQPQPAPLPPAAPPRIAAEKAATPISIGAGAQPATRDAGPPVASPEAAAPAAKETRGKSRSKGGKRPSRKSKGVQDEWGFFDPAQVGFAALLSKLDEITAEGEDQTSSDS